MSTKACEAAYPRSWSRSRLFQHQQQAPQSLVAGQSHVGSSSETNAPRQPLSTPLNDRRMKPTQPTSGRTSQPPGPQPVSAWEMLLERRQQPRLGPSLLASVSSPPSCSPNNGDMSWLRLSRPGIYELVGAAGTGKTQMALQTVIHAVFSTNYASSSATNAYYLSIGKSLTPKLERLQQMTEDHPAQTVLLHRIWTRRIWQMDDFWHVLNELSSTPSRRPCDLLVLDSIADLFRHGDDTMSKQNRQHDLLHVAQVLLQLQIPVLVVNQVTGNTERPALGVSWAHCVSQRYTLRHAACARRTVTLTKSPRYRTGQQVDFEIRRQHVALAAGFQGK